MYCVHLTEEQRDELQRRTRAAEIKPRIRARPETVRLPMHFWLKQFLDGGFDALPDQPLAGQTSRLTPALVGSMPKELDRAERTWTTGQLAAWLEEQHGVRFSRDHLGTLLRRAGLSCRRTERDLGHKQEPEQVAERAIEWERRKLEAADVHLIYLPAYTPELSRIEPHWKVTKYYGLPRRSYACLGDLKTAVTTALAKRVTELRLAAAEMVH